MNKIIKKIGSFTISENVYLYFSLIGLVISVVAIAIGISTNSVWVFLWPGFWSTIIFGVMLGGSLKMKQLKKEKENE